MEIPPENPKYYKISPLEEIAKTEKQIKKNINQYRLYNYWSEYPILRLLPSTLIYFTGKLLRKI